MLAAVELEGWCKTSGSKGLQLYVPLNTPGVTHEAAAEFALAVGQVLEKQLPKRVTTVMAKAVRPGKIFVDWSQNAHHKTTIAPYSLRARPEPTVSTPVTWDEVEACADGELELVFEAGDVLDRVAELGDLFEPVLGDGAAPPGVSPAGRAIRHADLLGGSVPASWWGEREPAEGRVLVAMVSLAACSAEHSASRDRLAVRAPADRAGAGCRGGGGGRSPRAVACRQRRWSRGLGRHGVDGRVGRTRHRPPRRAPRRRRTAGRRSTTRSRRASSATATTPSASPSPSTVRSCTPPTSASAFRRRRCRPHRPSRRRPRLRHRRRRPRPCPPRRPR